MLAQKRNSTDFEPPGSEADALRAALRYLGYSSRSEAEIRRYLSRRGYSTGAADSVAEKLRSLTYLNDETFARSWALTRAQDHGYGPRRIEQELRSKGVDQILIRTVLRETFDQVDEGERARSLLTKRFKGGDLTEPKTMRRAAAFLQRRGYSSKVVFNLLRYSIEDD
ncbi:MAG: regulatory protein RecX [Candidatus Binatia bacterium]